MKMKFHFTRVLDSDISVEADSITECTKKALELRELECRPTKINAEVIECE